MSVRIAGRRGEARYEHILDCALEVFGTKGFHSASIADICARAGIARGTLYQYFHDKRDVLVALGKRIVERVVEGIAAWPPYAPPPGPPDEAYGIALTEARCRAILDVVFDSEHSSRLILRVARTVDGAVEDALRCIEETVLSAIERDLRAALADGRIRPCDPALVARFLVGGIEHIVLAALDSGQPIERERVAREVAELFGRGLLLRAPAQGIGDG